MKWLQVWQYETNILEAFNHVLKSTHVMPVFALVQLIINKCNSY